MATDQVSSSVWVPLCCERVMRHNVFRSGDRVIAAAFVCTACGKNVALTPYDEAAQGELGAGAQVISVVAVAKPLKQSTKVQPTAGSDAETLG